MLQFNCLVAVRWLLYYVLYPVLTVSLVGLQCGIVVCPGHTLLLWLLSILKRMSICDKLFVVFLLPQHVFAESERGSLLSRFNAMLFRPLCSYVNMHFYVRRTVDLMKPTYIVCLFGKK